MHTAFSNPPSGLLSANARGNGCSRFHILALSSPQLWLLWISKTDECDTQASQEKVWLASLRHSYSHYILEFFCCCCVCAVLRSKNFFLTQNSVSSWLHSTDKNVKCVKTDCHMSAGNAFQMLWVRMITEQSHKCNHHRVKTWRTPETADEFMKDSFWGSL